jgi:23S rRNA pseudoU1915 N3-methylase RlmH
MIKIYIFADSYKHFESGIKEYEKRLGKTLEIVKLKPSKNSNSSLVIKEETALIIKKFEKES